MEKESGRCHRELYQRSSSEYTWLLLEQMHSASVPNRLGRAFDYTAMHTAAVLCYFTSGIVA